MSDFIEIFVTLPSGELFQFAWSKDLDEEHADYFWNELRMRIAIEQALSLDD